MFERNPMKSGSTAYQKINAIIDHLEQNHVLSMLENFIERMKAIDALELQWLDEIEQLNNTGLSGAEMSSLMQRTAVLKQKLDAADERFFTHLLVTIRANDRSTIREYFRKAEQQISHRTDDYLGYDELDMLVTGLLEVASVPAEPEERHADMIFYQPTPARIILKLIDELHPSSDDIFYDLGSGLGHVPILVNLLTDIKTKGVELEGAYFQYANKCLKKLCLANVEFIHADARHVDYSDGTLFYMYTPFQGEVLRQVLMKLEAQSERRPIRVCTYGPCTLQVSKQPWLQPIYQTGNQEGRLAIFGN